MPLVIFFQRIIIRRKKYGHECLAGAAAEAASFREPMHPGSLEA